MKKKIILIVLGIFLLVSICLLLYLGIDNKSYMSYDFEDWRFNKILLKNTNNEKYINVTVENKSNGVLPEKEFFIEFFDKDSNVIENVRVSIDSLKPHEKRSFDVYLSLNQRKNITSTKRFQIKEVLVGKENIIAEQDN